MSAIRIQLLLLAAVALGLSGCVGNLSIWGVNVPLPDGPGTGDDDDGPPDLDFSQYDGVEYLNISWSQQALEQGHVNCAEEYAAFGANTTNDDFNLCPECDEVWTITLVAESPGLPCISDGTDLPFEPTYVRKVGIDFSNSTDFVFHRNRQDADLALEAEGIGAMDGAGFTWSGIGGYIDPNPDLGYDFFFSGEGGF